MVETDMAAMALNDALTLITHVVADGMRTMIWTAARLFQALMVLAVLLVAWPVVGMGDSRAASPPPSRSAEVWAVEAAFREAMHLWAEERFEALWELGLLVNRYRVSREAFVRGMCYRVLKPTCGWGQLRTVQVHLQTAEEACRRSAGRDGREDAQDDCRAPHARLPAARGGGVARGPGGFLDQARGWPARPRLAVVMDRRHRS
jgi:hypothetical protein